MRHRTGLVWRKREVGGTQFINNTVSSIGAKKWYERKKKTFVYYEINVNGLLVSDAIFF